MTKRNQIAYYIVTAIFSLMILGGAITYFVDYDNTAAMFTSLGVSKSVIYPLAIAKILGVLAIWLIPSRLIKNLAYLGFALNLLMAIGSHILANDGLFYGPIVPLVLLTVSYWLFRKK
ncbi:MAG: DoxX family protein [Croceimicrobium sp.]